MKTGLTNRTIKNTSLKRKDEGRWKGRKLKKWRYLKKRLLTPIRGDITHWAQEIEE